MREAKFLLEYTKRNISNPNVYLLNALFYLGEDNVQEAFNNMTANEICEKLDSTDYKHVNEQRLKDDICRLKSFLREHEDEGNDSFTFGG